LSHGINLGKAYNASLIPKSPWIGQDGRKGTAPGRRPEG
jgi:hypothetical protein